MQKTFNDIAGYIPEKQEVLNICKTIENYEDLKDLGIKLPRGLLLYGPPGVGKTLFSKAIANKVNRKFIQVDFTKEENPEVKSLIKRKFKEAQNNSPSIIFIDEIDKLLTVNGFHSKYISDYTREILSLLLSLLDGFNKNEEILLIATANDLNSIPKALIRSGRIDKHIGISAPDDESRKAIIKHYLNKIKLKKEVDIKEITLITNGMTGSDIETMINEASIDVFNDQTNVLTTRRIIEFANRISGKQLVKLDEKRKLTKDDKIVAFHELGHFIVANVLKKVVKDISVINQSNNLGKFSLKKTSSVRSKEDLFDDVVISLGGMAAEKVFFNTYFDGKSNDLNKAYSILEHSVSYGDYGFDYLCSTISSFVSNEAKEKVRLKVISLLKQAYEKAVEIIKENKETILKIHPLLLKEKTLTGHQLLKYVKGDVSTNEEDEYADVNELDLSISEYRDLVKRTKLS